MSSEACIVLVDYYSNMSLGMYLKITGLILGLGLSQWAMAAINLVVPEEIVVLSINQKEIKPSFLRTGKNYKIEASDLTILARYQQYFDHRNSQHDILKSDVLVIQAKDLADQQQYALKLLDAPKDFEDARKYVEQPKIALIDARQNVRSTQSETQLKAPSLFNQLLGRDSANEATVITAPSTTVSTPLIVVDDSKHNNATTQTPVQNTQSSTTTTVPAITTKGSSAFSNHSTLSADQQLIQIWQKASKAERQKFLTWLAEQ